MRGLERAPSFLSDLLNTLTERGRALLGGRSGGSGSLPMSEAELVELGEALLSRRGEATGVALAQTLLAGYASADGADRLAFLKTLGG